jgi:hypothetical protein
MPQTPADIAVNNQMISDNITSLRNLALLALGGGVAARGVQSLVSTATPRKKVLPSSTVNVPVSMKTARLNSIGDLLGLYRDPNNPGESSFWKGHEAATGTGVPWQIPALAGAVAIPAYAGYQVANWLLNRRHKQDLKGRIEASRAELEQAIAEAQRPMQKAGAITKTSAIDRLAEKIAEGLEGKATDKQEKTAASWGDAAGMGVGGYSLAALIAALAGGAAGYSWTSKNDPYRIEAERTKRRLANQWAVSPPPVFVTPGRMTPDLSADDAN